MSKKPISKSTKTAVPASEPVTETKVPGRRKLTPAEKEARKAELAAETKEQKFERLAMQRVPKALKAIAVCGNLGSYKPSPELCARILEAFSNAIADLEVRLMSKTKNSYTYTLHQ